jgi:hypothetical protein
MAGQQQGRQTTAKPAAPATKDDTSANRDPAAANRADRPGATRTADVTGSGDTGPGTGAESPPDVNPAGQARMHTRHESTAAPIEAPDAAKQADPPEGLSTSSTNPVAGHAVLSTLAGEDHVALVDDDGNEIDDIESLLEPHEQPQTFRVVKSRIVEEFRYRNAATTTQRLLYSPGARISLSQAAALSGVVAAGRAQRDQQGPGQPVREPAGA